jgi:NADH:ubiquinone oxidoreductase subunit 4 (subunit M)
MLYFCVYFMLLKLLYGIWRSLRLKQSFVFKSGLKTTLFVYILSLILWIFFDQNFLGFQYSDGFYVYFNSLFIGWSTCFVLGVSGLFLFFIILTATIMPLTLLSGTHYVFFLQNIFISCFLAIELLFRNIDCFKFYYAFRPYAAIIPILILCF